MVAIMIEMALRIYSSISKYKGYILDIQTYSLFRYVDCSTKYTYVLHFPYNLPLRGWDNAQYHV
jgi:hypothetical protein